MALMSARGALQASASVWPVRERGYKAQGAGFRVKGGVRAQNGVDERQGGAASIRVCLACVSARVQCTGYRVQ